MCSAMAQFVMRWPMPALWFWNAKTNLGQAASTTEVRGGAPSVARRCLATHSLLNSPRKGGAEGKGARRAGPSPVTGVAGDTAAPRPTRSPRLWPSGPPIEKKTRPAMTTAAAPRRYGQCMGAPAAKAKATSLRVGRALPSLVTTPAALPAGCTLAHKIGGLGCTHT